MNVFCQYSGAIPVYLNLSGNLAKMFQKVLMSLQEFCHVYMACICFCPHRKLSGMSFGSICSRLALH